jgi:hypothetical protein
MPDRARRTHLVLSLLAFVAFMVLLLVTVGRFGVGTVELTIWWVFVIAGVALIWRRHRPARA